MKIYNSLVATVAAVAFSPLVYGDRVTLNFEDIDVSNDDECGSIDFSDQRYAGMKIAGGTVVNSVGTRACKNPIANVDLSDKLENNVLWGDDVFMFNYLTFEVGDYIRGNLSFDLAVDYSLLADGDLDDDKTRINVELQLLNRVDVLEDEFFEFFMTKNGTGPFSIEWNPEEGRYTAFSILVDIRSPSLSGGNPMIALDNISWEHYKVDRNGDVDDGNDDTTSSVLDTTAVSSATSGPPSSETETSAPATTSAPLRADITSSTFAFSSPTRTTEVLTSISSGLAQTSAPALFGVAAAFAAGAAFL
ncbi:hypothetical protein J3F84DRAFT_400640 [Trichoderma pleuroticola]